MSLLGGLLKVLRVLSPTSSPTRTPARPTPRTRTAPDSRPRARTGAADDPGTPGRSGPSATRPVDPARVGRVRMSYNPVTDGNADPGEIVWTWVPYEEDDGRGKDRPVLVVAAESGGTVLAVPLTSKPHSGADFVAVGAGGWDGQNRPSWAHVDRVLRVHPAGMRREAAALGARPFADVQARLRERYSWR
ncbi:hypothetical protein J2S58_001239 [Nakamurella flavida]|uniref:type II toxin-antitoxin system PemK/MazF family toxin n=1 Tax=Nakamurella flavida TaxID=363630 RepID=UPI00278B39B0|nr:type II toxin-antitoxin system PemK/MazF family toxin [Nakamurella flavida]MDP9777616.1 hypothetical protein [Nakamurella flavida]